MKPVLIGTRGSKLALAQAQYVAQRLKSAFPSVDFKLCKVTTAGDRIRKVSLSAVGGKGLFTKEIEDSLIRGEVDLAVHSLKDVPSELPRELTLSAFTNRLDPHDALISKDNLPFSALPSGAVVGTSSLRRKAQILAFRPDLKIVPLRGNVETRLRKLKEQNLDAVVIALAGLIRLGLADCVSEIVDYKIVLPAPGQGALAIQTRKGDSQIEQFARALDDPLTRAEVSAERELMRLLDCSCRTPFCALARVNGSEISLEAAVLSPDGTRCVREHERGIKERWQGVVRKVYDKLIRSGAEKILQSVRVH
jgi:hydroxymethylbilane synthase